MRVRRFPDAVRFLDAAEDFLLAREALLNMPLAIARHCRTDPARYPGPNYFAVVEDGAGIAGVAVMTPPHPLQLYVAPGPAVDAVAKDVADGWNPTGVVGPVAVADAFATGWCSRRRLVARLRLNLRGFELTAVTDPPRPRGAMRVAESRDLPLVESWYRAFHDELHAARSSIPPEEVARRAVGDGRVFLWDDGGPVAQTGIAGSTPNGARIGAVYTPPDRRRRGYATALVAAVSRRVLDDGKRFAFLFTDLANPISNSIYPKIGYRPVADLRELEFVAG
jgi:hypothetical protein